MVHKLAPAANNSPADASHLIFLMGQPNRAAARRRTGLAGALFSGWTEFYCKRDDMHQKSLAETLIDKPLQALTARDAKDARGSQM